MQKAEESLLLRVKKYILVPVVILALSFMMILSDLYVNTAFAAYSVVTNSHYENSTIPNLEIYMDSGTIMIDATSKAAGDGTTVRYKTIGFGVSLSTQTRQVSIGGYQGPDAPENVGILYFSEAEKVDRGSKNGYNTTRFIFRSERVNQILSGKFDLEAISNETYIYLNGVFQSYIKNPDGTETILKGSEGGLTTWSSIMRAEDWSAGSLEGFAKYFNIPIKFSPGSQPVKLYKRFYNSKNGLVDTEELDIASININARVTWGSKLTEATDVKSGKTYEIIGCQVKPKLSAEKINGTTYWYPEGQTAAAVLGIVKGAYIEHMPLGGVNIYVDYKEVTQVSNSLYYKCDNTTKIVINLATVKVGQPVTWGVEVNANPPENYLGAGEYLLQGYFITTADGVTVIRSRMKTKTTTVSDLLDDSVEVGEKGVRVTMIFTPSGPTITPTPTPVPTGTVSPTPKPSPTPVPAIPPLVVPEGGAESKPLDTFYTEGVIRADLRGSERFNVLQGIPTTESLYTQVQGNSYNLGYSFTKKVVIKTYPIKVTKVYHLSWSDANTKTKLYKKDVTVTKIIDVERACSFWVIDRLDYYIFDHAVIYNNALSGGSTTMYPNGAYYSPPPLYATHSYSEDSHIIPPAQSVSGIQLEETLPQGDGVMPKITPEDFTYQANMQTEEIKVKSDYLAFNGCMIMDNSVSVKEAPDLTNLYVLNEIPGLSNQNVFYKPDQVIPADTLNNIYYSSGMIIYRNHSSSVNSSGSNYAVPVNGLNSVTVHTPVICDASIVTQNVSTGITSNDTYVQAIDVDKDCVQLVIDPDPTLSDFTVDIDNYGKHMNIPGYCTRNYAWNVRDGNVSYIATKNSVYRNEVKFPFDVFVRRESGDNDYITKNTWIRIGHLSPTFYLPMWVKEGIHAVMFRTIAVNGTNDESQLSKTQTYANLNRSNYVATDTIRVQVSGRIYGLTIYDVSDYPTWEEVFRMSEGSSILKSNDEYTSGVSKNTYNKTYAYDYTVGISNQYGQPTGRLSKYTFPLVNGSHPVYANIGVLKTGYSIRYKLKTTGSSYGSGSSIAIKPTFYHVDAEGKNRQEVDIYYSENFNGASHKYVKMGSALDLTNIKSFKCGEKDIGIPESFLKIMAGIAGTNYNSYLWRRTDLFTYTDIRMRLPLMVYSNTEYLQKTKISSQYTSIKEAGVSDVDIINRMQTYYGEYFLPANIKAVVKGFDVSGQAYRSGINDNETFWLKDGFIIVNLDIVSKDGEGKNNLSYINEENAADGYCSMWALENPVPRKLSYNGSRQKLTVFNFLPGDCIVYYTSRSLKEDYETYIVK